MRLAYLIPLFALAALAALVAAPAPARACGCFTPPDPANLVVQSGEQILFSAKGGQVTAIIQIQFQGAAEDFGWLLPLPSVPTLEVSSDELFAALQAGTTPSYQVVRRDIACMGDGGPDATSLDLGINRPDFSFSPGGPDDPLVAQGGVGPYDYAVLKADDKTAMLDWLKANRYFVPAGTDGVVDRYVHPGAYFLALKLHPGRSAGDLQPVVVRYASDLPMIPIALTSVTATDDMGVWVWVAGDARAIPRNYRHVVLDDAALSWGVGPAGLPWNYEAQVARAVREAQGHHAFVTEMARPLATLRETLLPAWRYGNLDDLRLTTDASDYLRYLRLNGYTFGSTLVEILARYIKRPPGLQAYGRAPSQAGYYYNFDQWRQLDPQAFSGFDLTFDPGALTGEIEARIVRPMREARALLDGQAYLTRLHTRLGPADMNSDPVFAFNADLPEVSSAHVANLVNRCDEHFAFQSTLYTEQGFAVPAGAHELPGALRVEVLHDSGPPTVEVDNTAAILRALGQPPGERFDADAGVLVPGPSDQGGGACAVGARDEDGSLAWLLSLPLAALIARRLRRRPRG